MLEIIEGIADMVANGTVEIISSTAGGVLWKVVLLDFRFRLAAGMMVLGTILLARLKCDRKPRGR